MRVPSSHYGWLASRVIWKNFKVTQWFGECLSTYLGRQTAVVGTLATAIGNQLKPTANTHSQMRLLLKSYSDVEQKIDVVAMEVSSTWLSQGRCVNVCQFDVAILTT